MNPLLPSDLGVAPLYLLRGRPAIEQAVLLWAWQAELAGAKWSLASLARAAGTTGATAGKTLAALAEEGVVTAGDGAGPYRVNVDFVPERKPEPVKAKAKKDADPIPVWVFDAMKAWKDATGGSLIVRQVQATLAPLVAEHGKDAVVAGLRRYAEASDPQWNPNVYKFAANPAAWMPVRSAHAPAFGGTSMRDLLKEA